jgi:hypothetical protein
MVKSDEENAALFGKPEDDDEDSEIGGIVKDTLAVDPEELDEDTFGMSVCAIVRDTYAISTSEGGMAEQGPRYVRLCTTCSLLIFTIFLQIFLLVNLQKYVTAKAVHDVRDAYSKFEGAIYNCTGEPQNCYTTPFGSWRGNEGLADTITLDVKRDRLNSLSDGDQGNACRISLSQPPFIFVILLIWTFTCLFEMRKTVHLSYTLFCLKKVSGCGDTLDADKEIVRDEDGEDHEITNGAIIVGLPIMLKVVLVLLMLVRILVTCVLLFLGCRWLLATNRFADLILNAVALEFILLLKETTYNLLVPLRNKLEIKTTTIDPAEKKLKPDCFALLNTFGLALVAALWVFLYMYWFQNVLPNYNWDVRAVCQQWIKERFCIQPGGCK